MGNLRMNADQISYKGGEKPMSVEEAIKNAGNTGLAHTADIAPDFSTETAYSAGDYVYHNGTLYVFTSNHSAGAWSTSDTQAVTVGGEIATLAGEASDLYAQKANQITIAPFFSAEASYEPGDLVYYNGLSYRCVNAHEGAWDADDFAATTIANELDTLKCGLINLHGYTDISSSILDPSLSFTATENCILWLRTSNAENVAPYYNYLVNNTIRGLKGGVGATLDHYVFLRAGDVFKFNDSYPYEPTLTNNVYLV